MSWLQTQAYSLLSATTYLGEGIMLHRGAFSQEHHNDLLLHDLLLLVQLISQHTTGVGTRAMASSRPDPSPREAPTSGFAREMPTKQELLHIASSTLKTGGLAGSYARISYRPLTTAPAKCLFGWRSQS